MRFAIFPVHLSKVVRLPRKSAARSYEVLHLSRKIIAANLKIWCSKMQPLSGNQRPDLLTSLMNMSLVLGLPRKMHLCRSKCHTPAVVYFRKCNKTFTFFPHFWHGAQSRAPATRNGIWTSRRCPSMCFSHFGFETCFAPQRRALFRRLNLQKCSGPVHFFTLLTSKWCASRRNGVQFFISHLASWLRTRRFSGPTFGPSGATNHWKTTAFRDFPTFSRTWIFFLLTLSDSFSFLIFFLLLFSSLLILPIYSVHLSIFSEVWPLNFLQSSADTMSFWCACMRPPALVVHVYHTKQYAQWHHIEPDHAFLYATMLQLKAKSIHINLYTNATTYNNMIL